MISVGFSISQPYCASVLQLASLELLQQVYQLTHIQNKMQKKVSEFTKRVFTHKTMLMTFGDH